MDAGVGVEDHARVGPDRLVQGQALGFAVLGDQGDPGGDGLAGPGDPPGLAVDRDGAAGEGFDAEDRLGDLGAARALEPGEADDLAGADLEVDAVDLGVAAAGDGEADLAGLGAGQRFGEDGLDPAADHGGDQFVGGDVGGVDGGDALAVLEDGDAVAQVEDLAEPVGDVQDRHALVAEALDEAVEQFDLGVGQGGGGLVHADEVGALGHGLGDLDDLLAGDRERLGLRGGGEVVDAEVGQERGGALGHGAAVDQAASPRLAPEVDVLGDAELGQEVELLEDGGDPGVLGLEGVGEGDGAAAQLDGAGVGGVDAGEDLHQGGLAGAVLPHHGVDLSRLDHEVHRAEHRDAEEGLVDAAHGEHRGLAHAATSTQSRRSAEAATASAMRAARRPSAKTGSPSGVSPAMAARVSATKSLKQSW